MTVDFFKSLRFFFVIKWYEENREVSMESKLKQAIKKDRQIMKFCGYGFLKNLKFFEPYLVLFLMSEGLNLFEIGVLYGLRELIIYVFEIPSGIIADVYGRKKELYMCFGFYMISFILFFIGKDFMGLAFAMSFFGLGEAFRSGTHKAMIYTYLERKDWSSHKAYVYGRTRSFSLIGSFISAIIAIILILISPSIRYIFLASIIPYIMDLFLIMSYPEALDFSGKKFSGKLSDIVKTHFIEILSKMELRKILVASALFDSIFKSIKDLIQPILESLIISSGVVILYELTPDDNLKIILGLSYGLIYIIGAFASRRAYILKEIDISTRLLNKFHLTLAAILGVLFISILNEWVIIVILLYVLLYAVRDMRKPIFVDVCDDYMEKHQRATVLSIESQLKALFTVILAPVIGLLADNFGIQVVMLGLGVILIVSYRFIKMSEGRN